VKTALVTGGAKRIGEAIVRELANSGYGVAIHCNASRAEADALAAELAAGGARTAVVAGDLVDPAICSALVGRAAAQLGPLTLLVNNASLFESDTLQDFEFLRWNRHFSVNARAPALLAQAFAAQVGGADDPSIVNIVDQRVLNLTPQNFSYTLSKAALHAATTTMAQALAPRIRVNAVGPGPTAPSVQDGEAGLAKEAAGVPLQHGVTPREIADAVLYLACARSVTGQMIAVDAGQHIGWRTPDIIEK
jgi:NAD(P)-dependent dehydrogenase (short-subunit alcohol dehydrogenase family)